MAYSRYLKKYFIYLIILTPLMVIFAEILLTLARKDIGITTLGNNAKTQLTDLGRTKYDPINGWRQKCNHNLEKMLYPNDLICNKHGLIKTPYQSDQQSQDNILGILLLGNSVAMGEGL